MATRNLAAIEELGNPAPVDHGFTGWAFDPVAAIGTYTIVPNGTPFLFRVVASRAASISKIWFEVITAGATLTVGQCFAGLYDTAGARLGVTADQAVAWQSTGIKSPALTANVAVTAGTPYLVVVLVTGSTGPTLLNGVSNVSANNVNLAGANRRFMYDNTAGQTSLPSSLPPAGWQTLPASPWCAISP